VSFATLFLREYIVYRVRVQISNGGKTCLAQMNAVFNDDSTLVNQQVVMKCNWFEMIRFNVAKAIFAIYTPAMPQLLRRRVMENFGSRQRCDSDIIHYMKCRDQGCRDGYNS
jgi:hypothetical protein